MNNKKSLHYIAHTHWDKEWYKTYEEFRVKFIKYFRDILDTLENDSDFTSFMFDGQSSVIDDYIQLYPDEYNRVAKLIKEKKLLVGPWYTLPDNYLTNGESLSRNLLIGSRMAKKLGYSQNVCYIPDSFGQTDMMPQIIKEMELKGAILWRGVDSTQTNNAVFKWTGSSGDSVNAVHLSLGYGYSKKIPEDGTHFEYINEIYDLLKEKYKDDVVLFMGGSDHQPIQKSTPKLLKDINDKWSKSDFNGEIKISNIDDFYDEIIKKVDLSNVSNLFGELRSVRDQRIHFGDASGRADLKKLNREVEVLLSTIVEPILSINSILYDNVYEKELLNYAWKLVFSNQAHDSACTTCTDEIHSDIYIRYIKAKQIGMELINFANKNLFASVKVCDEIGVPELIYNLSPKSSIEHSNVIIYSENKNFKLLDSHNNEIEFDILEQQLVNKNFENVDFCNYVSMMSFGDDFKQQNKGQTFNGTNVPVYKNVIRLKNDLIKGLGYKIIYIKNINNDESSTVDSKVDLNNIFGKFKINSNGTINANIKDIEYKNLCFLESTGEDGDSYDYSPPKNDVSYNTLELKPLIEIVQGNKNLIKVKVSYNWELPVSLTEDRMTRKNELINNKVEVLYTFENNKDNFDVEINFNNKSKEHIVSINLPFISNTENHKAGQQFGSIIRTNELENDEDWTKTSRSKNYAQYPFQRFVSIDNKNAGIGVITNDSSEYKIKNNKEIKIILFRSFGYMGKANLEFRPGRPSGIYWQTPDSYMIKNNKINLTIGFYNGENNFESLVSLQNRLVNPLISFEVIRDVFFESKSVLVEKNEDSIFSISNDKVTVSTFKKCEDEEAYIIRLYNSTNSTIENIELKCFKNFDVYISNINESTFDKLSNKSNMVNISKIDANKILNLKFIKKDI